ncbi:MAG: phosphatase PAP2 family protein [bacterium]
MFLHFFGYIFLFVSTISLLGQGFNNTYKSNNTLSKIYSGLAESVDWYDLPVFAAYLSRTAVYNSNLRSTINIGPSYLDSEISEDFGNSRNNSIGSMDKDLIPDYIFYSRLALTAAADIFTDADISSKSFRQIFLFKKSLLYTYTLTEIVKNSITRNRPDNSDSRSFFSGHTATAFAASTFLYRELDDFYDKWDVTRADKKLRTTFKIASFGILYGWAGYVGYSRIYDKKHYLSDVITGAAVGTIISYFVYEHFNQKFPALHNINLSTGNKSLFVSYKLDF